MRSGGHPVSLAPLPQRAEPETVHLILESAELPLVTRHRIIVEMPVPSIYSSA